MSGRRANGEGSIYKRKDGRYAASAYVPTRTGPHVVQAADGQDRTRGC
jgi:hypothetical protein